MKQKKKNRIIAEYLIKTASGEIDRDSAMKIAIATVKFVSLDPKCIGYGINIGSDHCLIISKNQSMITTGELHVYDPGRCMGPIIFSVSYAKGKLI
jgi:hypothetical protein